MTRGQVEEVIRQSIPYINSGSLKTALEETLKELEIIGHLKDRPCEACEFHKENGCCKWNCVFDELIYGNK